MINADFRPIHHVDNAASGFAGGLTGAAETAGADAAPFADLLSDAISRVEGYRASADQAVNRFVHGEEEEVHKVAIATQQAEMEFNLFLQVKNKVVQAYQEVMRMQL